MANRYFMEGKDKDYNNPNNWTSKGYTTFKGSGYWHEAKKWSGGKIPTINDDVLLSYHTGDIIIGYDKKSLEYKLRKLLDIITLGLTNILVYNIYYSSLTINQSLEGSSVTFSGNIKTNTPFTYQSGTLVVEPPKDNKKVKSRRIINVM